MELSQFTSSNMGEIIALFTQVFSDSEGVTEGEVVGHLVTELLADKDKVIPFVAMDSGEIIASICFSELVLSSHESAFILSPVAVKTKEQGKGIGQKLINHALNYLRSQGIDFVFTYGDPNYYSRVGFQQISPEQIEAPFELSYPHGWLAQSLNGKDLAVVKCSTQCVSALNKREYW
ncbi:GNAT family N-acetyltransferase [Vibrio salinus]|uniref:GNAT family N-acetyltransferase n=1 Tax=Vibrio salinus TaxID=2899784 RepID=UPI001E2A8DE3|nr:N-acetyltransferase [Vibrio salinus]MCE0495440.1 N-acetyltransferase [Vibrio salinus]